MPSRKRPCVECRDKHVKCDEAKPVCGRCRAKSLACNRPSRRSVFKPSDGPIFTQDQAWVTSKARAFRFDARSKVEASQGLKESGKVTAGNGSSATAASMSTSREARPRPTSGERQSDVTGLNTQQAAVSRGAALPQLQDNGTERHSDSTYRPHELMPSLERTQRPPLSSLHRTPSYQDKPFPLEDVQEACLLRYYVEELSHWFDLCDESRHFQLAVPLLARRHTHLMNAIFAVAARHLSRMPRFKTPEGIMYHGQLLPNLDQNAPMEYTLECIPALRQFHDLQDNEYRESIVATAVILRQLEEIDDEDDVAGLSTDRHASSGGPQINFLPIIDAILRSPPSRHLFALRGVTQAAYWMALRQEIYHSFTRREPPQMFLAAEYWAGASKANKSVMHTVQVAKWCWGERSEQEWDRLMAQQELLEESVLVDYRPILKKSPDKSRGEIFPTVWFGSTIEVTSNQQAIVSRSVLMAENPRYRNENPPRSQWRQLENDVKLLILELCGIALCHPASPPVLVNAAIGIQLYGDFFTDHYERQALRRVVEKYRDTYAWPVQKLLEMFD